MLGVIHRHHIDVKDIDAVEVESTSGAMRISNRARPENLIDAQYSVPYCLAIAAMLGPGALLPMTEKVLENEALAELAGKVELSISPEFDAVFPAQTLARVTVTSRGQRFVSPVTSPRGEASDPLSWAELEAKFRTATRMLATDIQQDRILGSLGELRSGSLAALKACLARPVGSRG
jgi:2-methylcitrate dehydratase PrpD